MTDERFDPALRGDPDPEAERIVSEIEETRSRMGATIDEIGHRLQPQTIAEDARDKIREATVGKVERMVDDAGQSAQRAGNNLIETIQQNPVPAALAALGVGWLALRMRDQQASGNENQWRYSSGARQGYTPGYAEGYRARDDSGSDPLARAQGVADGAIARAQDMGASVQHAAQTAVEDTQQKVQQAQWQAQGAVRDAQWTFDRTLNENPLALGALAVGVGAAVALAIPETEKERELMGEQRDRLVEQAGTIATQALDEAQTRTQEVGEQLRSEG